MKLRLLLMIPLALLWLATNGRAQTVSGTLQGRVTDQASAVLPGVTITIHNTETGQERTVTTNEEGFYTAPFLPLGRYKVRVSLKGFGTVVRDNLDIPLNQTIVADFSLKPTVVEEVTITAEQAPINTTNAEIKQSLSSQEILDKPTLAPNNFLSLAETFTGFQENPTSGQNNPTASSGSSINFNGTGTRGATFQINGVNNDDSSENQHRQGAALSTIKEFQVITNNFSAEFGRGYGAVVLVQTKSGTNQIHGDVYEFHQDSALNAKSHFATGVKKPVNRRNEYGFTVGFPLMKEKLFGFLSLDETRNTGAGNYTRDLLLAGERSPKLSGANDTPANRAWIESIIARFPASLTPNDARSPRTFASSVGFNRPLKDYSGRFDWNPTRGDNIFARWQYTRQIFDNQDIILGEATKQNNRQQNWGLTWTHQFTDRFVGEFRYGRGMRNTLVGIKEGNDTPIVRFSGSPVSGTIIGNAGTFPINRYQTDNQFVYNVSTLFGGNHVLKAGTDTRRQKLDDLADNFSRGFWTFSPTCGGVTLATAYDQFLRGCVTTFQKAYGPFFLENRINESNFYAEDNWKIRPNLTLSFGARYEYVGSPREIRDRVDYGFGADNDNIEPRFGFAYTPRWEKGFLSKLSGGPGNSSIRGGYGIFHGRLFQSVFSQSGATVRFNPPNALFLTFSNSLNVADPTNGFVFTPGPQTIRHAEAHVDPDLQMPYTQQWNLTVERQLPLRSALRLSYTGNRGIGLLRYAQENLPISPLVAGGVVVANHPNNAPEVLYTTSQRGPGDPRGIDVRGKTLTIAADPICAGTGLSGIPVTAQCPAAVPLGPTEISLRVPRTNERRPDGAFTTNTLVSNGSWSYYHGLQIEWNKNLSKGLATQVSYSYGKAIDTTSEATFVGTGDSNINGPNTKVSRSLSRFDTRQRLTVYSTYVLPFLRAQEGALGRVLGGWQLSTVMKLASGTPFSVVNGSGIDLNFDGFAESRPALVDRSVLYGHITHPSKSQLRLPAAAFRPQAFSDFGCCILGRNTFFVDGVVNFDFGIYKNVRMPFEGHRLTFRTELYNAFNHVQYGFPSNDLASGANFGRIVGTAVQYSPRTIQFAFRYQF